VPRAWLVASRQCRISVSATAMLRRVTYSFWRRRNRMMPCHCCLDGYCGRLTNCEQSMDTCASRENEECGPKCPHDDRPSQITIDLAYTDGQVGTRAINEIRRRVSSSSPPAISSRAAAGDDDQHQIYGRTVDQVTDRAVRRTERQNGSRASDGHCSQPRSAGLRAHAGCFTSVRGASQLPRRLPARARQLSDKWRRPISTGWKELTSPLTL